MTAHAKLSASGSARWIQCTPSAALEAKCPDTSSDYAAEGTLAHELAESMLKHRLGHITKQTYSRHQKRYNGHDLWSPDMLDYISDYCDLVQERINSHEGQTEVLLEQCLDFSRWVPKGFGTGDVVILSDTAVEVIDLKYGKGVPVSAEGNSQLRLYGLGAWDTYGVVFGADQVMMTIVQPRLDSISTEILPVDDLVDWADEVVQPAAAKAWAGEGAFLAGDHCRWCKVKEACRARAERNLELARMEFRDPPLLSDEEIGHVLGRAVELKAWASDVESYALDQAVNHGKSYPGYKVVEGRSSRQITDEQAVAKVLADAGWTDEDIYRPQQLQTLTALEKRIGKKKFSELVNDYIVKPAGKPTLVPESDKRPGINSTASAQAAFAD